MKITAETITKFKWSVGALRQVRKVAATLAEDIYDRSNGVMRGAKSEVWSKSIDLRDAIDNFLEEMKKGDYPE